MYLLEKIVLAHFKSLFETSYCNAFWENEGKINKEGCVKEFFLKTCKLESQLHYKLTSSQVIFTDFK